MVQRQSDGDSGKKDDDNVDDDYKDATKQRFLQEIQDASIVHIGWSGDEYDSGKKDDENVDDEYEDATQQRFLQEIQDASIVHIGWSSVKVMMSMIVIRMMMMIIRTPPSSDCFRKYKMSMIAIRKMKIMLTMEIQDEYDSGKKDDDNVDDDYKDATKQRFLQEIQDEYDSDMKDDDNVDDGNAR